MRVLALDWGTVRIGAAISDPDGKIAFPIDRYFESKTAIKEIKNLVSEKNVEKILIGLPKSLSGKTTASSSSAQEFGAELKKNINCPIEFIDERYSSVAASKTLSESGIKSKQQRGQIDNLAAQQLLQAYLDKK